MSPLYGAFPGGINQGLSAISRRALIAGALALPVAARAGAIRTVKALNWTGTAHVEAGERTLVIDVKTRVEPFVRARSETRLTGTTDTRTLIIEPDGGWVERGGARSALPAAQTAHEREQYGIYGYILSAIQQGGDAVQTTAMHEGYPPFQYRAVSGQSLTAVYTVDAPDGNGSIAEIVQCDDWKESAGLLWPYLLTIDQRPGKGPDSRFSLALTSFIPEFA